jgi:hypothetical protein
MNNKNKPIFAPGAGHLIQRAKSSAGRQSHPLTLKADKLVREIKKLKIQGDDGFRSLFIEAERGDISDFGDYKEFLEEEVVENYEDFIELWKGEYPEAVKWYKLSFSEYNDVYYIGIVPEYIFPRYCHSSFPAQDRIIDFMNLYTEHEHEIIQKARWYPVGRVEPDLLSK